MPNTKKNQHGYSGTLSIASAGNRLTLWHWAPSRGRRAQRRPEQNSSRRTIRQLQPVFLRWDEKKHTGESEAPAVTLRAAILNSAGDGWWSGGGRVPISEDDFMMPMLSLSHCTTPPAMATEPWGERGQYGAMKKNIRLYQYKSNKVIYKVFIN